jgi:hypothetical protein
MIEWGPIATSNDSANPHGPYVGDSVGDYEVLEPLGAGGMGLASLRHVNIANLRSGSASKREESLG